MDKVLIVTVALSAVFITIFAGAVLSVSTNTVRGPTSNNITVNPSNALQNNSGSSVVPHNEYEDNGRLYLP